MQIFLKITELYFPVAVSTYDIHPFYFRTAAVARETADNGGTAVAAVVG